MKILVAVIAYNEELSIQSTLEDLRENNFGFDIVVVDNGSSDKTTEICRQLAVPYFSHPVNSGSSYGTVNGYFLYADSKGYDIVCQFDGDGQHMATELKKIVDPILEDRADFVIGSRFIQKKGFQSTPLRKFVIKIFSAINSFVIGKKITDTTSGFKAYGKKIIEFFSRNYRKEIFDINQILLLSHSEGARIVEVPVTMRPRTFGKSEFNFKNAVSFPINGLVNILGCILQMKKAR